MKFKDVEQTEDGMHFNVIASNAEVTYLVDFAVQRLIAEGIISLNNYEKEQEVELREATH